MEENIYDRARKMVETQKYKLAAASLHHYLKIYNEQLTIENITDGIRETLEAETFGDGRPLNQQLIKQANTLDALFDYLLNNANGKYTSHETIELALRAQRQSLMTTAKYRDLQCKVPRNLQTE